MATTRVMNAVSPDNQLQMESVEAARDFLRSVSATTRRRGQAYFSTGAVRSVECLVAGTDYVAHVQGTIGYETTLSYEAGEWFSECSCPIGGDCKHAVAAMLAVLERAGHGGTVASLTANTSQRTWTKTAYNAPPPPSSRVLEEALEKALGRKLDKFERDFCSKLNALYRRASVNYPPNQWDLKELGIIAHFNYQDPHKWWTRFPKDALDFWQHLAYGLRRRRVKFPAFLDAISDDARIEAALRAWQRQQEIEKWRNQLHWIGEDRSPQGQVGAVDFRLVIERGKVSVEWKTQQDAQFLPLKVAQHKRLTDAHARGDLEVVEDAIAIWHGISNRWSYSSTGLSLFNDDAKRWMRSLLMMPTLRGRIVTHAREPFVWRDEMLQWQLKDAEREDGDYELRLVSQDGSRPSRFQLVLDGRPTLYLTDKEIFRGPPEIKSKTSHFDEYEEDGEESESKVIRIPAPALESREGIQFLNKLRVTLPPRLRARVRVATMKVRAVCELKPDPWRREDEFLVVTIRADSDADKHSETFTADGWQSDWKQQLSETRVKGDQFIEYDRSAMNPVAHWMSLFGGRWDYQTKQWTSKISKTFAAKFLPWLQAAPPSVELLLDKQLATFRDAPLAASVRLDVEPSGIDWFDLKVVVDVADTDLTPDELKLLLHARGGFVRLGNKGWRRLQFNFTDEDNEQLARLGLSANDFSAEPQRLHALQLADKAASKFLPEETVREVRRRAEEIQTRVAPPVPDAIRAALRPYQLEGFHFLAYLASNNFGGVLADDMGLGKTLQALTWLTWLRAQNQNGGAGVPPVEKNQTAPKPNAQNPKPSAPSTSPAPRPSLVVCPKSVTDNWLAESEKFAPHLRVRVWRGTDGAALTRSLDDADLFVVNYSQLRALGDALGGIQWHAAILDEGQYIKNPESQTAKVARALQAQHRLVLTGTPIENRLMDLWSLMSFAMPGVLSNRTQFARQFDRADDPFARRRLAARVRPFVLRRTKAQVAKDLPERAEEDLLCDLEGEQQTLYRAELKRAQQMLLRVQTQQEFDKNRFNFLTSLLRLRQICCHPALVNEKLRNAESAKVNALLELLEPLMEEGHKVLVFSQFVTMLDLLRPAIVERGWQHFYLTGATENRGELVQQFQNADGAALFLISLKAGGFGLNLTAASYVVLFDPWWNPAVEMQAIDRTHRIGQTRKVMAYRLLTKNSIEEKIRKLQVAKRALAEDVLGEENFAKALTLDDLRFLFSE